MQKRRARVWEGIPVSLAFSDIQQHHVRDILSALSLGKHRYSNHPANQVGPVTIVGVENGRRFHTANYSKQAMHSGQGNTQRSGGVTEGETRTKRSLRDHRRFVLAPPPSLLSNPLCALLVDLSSLSHDASHGASS